MKKTSFCNNWTFSTVGVDGVKSVTLPHDAMLGETRSNDNPCGTNCAWISGNDYIYEKEFDKIESEVAFLEFEAVYHNAEVYLNEEKIAERPYGFTNFYVDLIPHQKQGKNKLRVIAHNADQPNSRWYSGAGIYRPVWLYTAPKEHILCNGIKIKTVSINPAVVEIEVDTSSAGIVKCEILDGKKSVFTTEKQTDGKVSISAQIENARLWSETDPYLYTLFISFGEDVETVTFGIRTLTCTAQDGFCINGERVMLRGCCIHSENGLIGACTYPEIEERKVKKLKSAGYNAIRCAHNPCSKFFLDACDKLGMYVMDEYVDMWYIHKTRFDYAPYVADWYKQDLTDMVDKDYSHPCVIMYSLGNEVSESATKKGVDFFAKMKQVIDEKDGTRPVTAGINIMFNWMASVGMGIYSDEKAEKNPQKKVGSEFFNAVAGILGAHTMKMGAAYFPCGRRCKDVFAASDVAGYNYGELRYKRDLKKYPERIIVGSETFCSDAYKFYELAKKEKRLIGDFVWAGMDYLGEVGIGSWEYKDYAPDYKHVSGWISAGSGRTDLTGSLLGEALFTRVAFELEDKPQIAVVPVNHTNESHSPSAWKFSNALNSWSFDGYDGKPAKVEVYARGDKAELFINGKSCGKKSLRNKCRVIFKTKYYNGTVSVKVYDNNGKVIGENELHTASPETQLRAVAETQTVAKGGIAHIRLQFTDEKGTIKPLERDKINVKVKGGTLLALGHACPYNPDGYLNDWTDTYFGQALAIVKADGDVELTASCKYGSSNVKIKCEE